MIGFFRRSKFLPEVRLPKNVTWGLAANTCLRDMGIGSITLFLPIYLFQIGGLWLLVAYMAGSRLWDFLLSRRVSELIVKLGYKRAMIIASLMMAIALVVFRYAESYPWLVLVAALLEPSRGSLYWVTHHLLFLQNRESEMGHKSSWIMNIGRWSSVLGPIVGGVFISTIGFGGLFSWGIALVVLSSLPILAIDDRAIHWEFELDKYWQRISGKWFRKDLIAHLGRGIEESMFDVYWPVFLFMILGGSHLALGQFKSSILVISSVLIFFMGKRLDRYWPKKYLVMGIVALMILWIIRADIASSRVLWGLDLLDGLLAILVFFPFGIYTYHRAKVSEAVLYMTEREAITNLGRAVAAVGVGILHGLGFGWNALSVLAVAGLALMMFIPDYQAEVLAKK